MLIGCFLIEHSSHQVKAKTCLFTGQVDLQHMPFTYVTYNPDSRDNNLCDKRILAITNLETYNNKNKPKKGSVQYFLNCSYRLGLLKDSKHPMNYDFCTDLTLEPNKMAGCSEEKNRRRS